MAAKDVRFSTEAREGIARGVDILANAVRITLGPNGRNVLLDKSYGAPRITKDGVTVVKEIELTDKFEPSAEKCRRVPRRMSFTTCSAGFLAIEDLALIFVPSSLRREPNPP